MFTKRKINRQKEQLRELAALLRQHEEIFRRTFSASDKPEDGELDELGAKERLADLGLPTKRSGQLALLTRQSYDQSKMSPKEVCQLQADQLVTIAHEIAWYDWATRSMLDGKGAREASHHDASELLDAMGL